MVPRFTPGEIFIMLNIHHAWSYTPDPQVCIFKVQYSLVIISTSVCEIVSTYYSFRHRYLGVTRGLRARIGHESEQSERYERYERVAREANSARLTLCAASGTKYA